MRAPLLALLVSSGLAWAQQLSFGVQVQAVAPIKEFKTHLGSRPGGGGGAHFWLGLADGLALRPRADWVQFRIKNYEGFQVANLVRSNVDARVTQSQLGLDLLWYLDGTTGEGFYLVARGSAVRSEERLEGSLQVTSPTGTTQVALPQRSVRQTHPHYFAGFGFGIGRRLSLEFLYGNGTYEAQHLSISSGQPTFQSVDSKAPTFSTGLIYTF